MLMGLQPLALATDNSNASLEEFSSDLLALYSLSGTTKRQLADMNPKAKVYAVNRILKQAQAFETKWRDSDLIEFERFRFAGGDQLILDVEFHFK
ncbi:hypothetical protein C5748_03775 [Phyllobacterium phragmitis]|uniref:Uncharacterized protein n=2 Tax=Phyllobacterium phragmitis TaxID=2670329 RepID=A0A2S9IXR6_9HYPH|nr:hypothetical protein C5748_03775 [Phyllobacterium phragmitis]